MCRGYDAAHMSEDEESERDSAPPGEVVVAAEDQDQGEEDWSPFDEIQEDFKPRPIPKVTASDGLPTNFAPVNDDDIPVLSRETLTCMGDYSKFVIRGMFGDVVAEFESCDVERSPSGRWRARKSDVVEALKMEVERVRAYHREHGLAPPHASDELVAIGILAQVKPDAACNNAWVEVEPIRPPCIHYARQLTQFDLNAQAQVMLRVCSARRTTEGAFMSLRDRAMWACELREPPAPDAFETLEAFDRRKMREGEQRELIPMFGGAIAAEDQGIFGGANGGKQS